MLSCLQFTRILRWQPPLDIKYFVRGMGEVEGAGAKNNSEIIGNGDSGSSQRANNAGNEDSNTSDSRSSGSDGEGGGMFEDR